jgi:predicted ribosomally synthesized peptide with SipW-like signal peptide
MTNENAVKGMSMKKKALIVLCALVSVVVIVASSVLATVAYLTSSAAVSNVFTIGKVTMTMTETKVDADGKKLASGEQVDTNTYHLVNNKTYDKDPTIFIEKGSENSYLFVLVRNDLSGIAAAGEKMTPVDPTKYSIAYQMALNGWAKYIKASTGWVYVYVGFDEVGGEKVSKVDPTDANKTDATTFTYTPATVGVGEYKLFDTFTIAPNADISTYGAAKITLTGVAIQDEGFNGDIAKVWKAVTDTYPYIHTGNAPSGN